MKTTNIKHIAALAEVLAVNGIQHIVISPGSRNAPLVIAFENHLSIQTYVVHDERSAAFFALGLAEAIDQPVGLVCTSGSAPLNYAPAIAEAYYRQIPLLVLTADRPAHLIDQGDGQCINQNNIYQNYIKAYLKLPEQPKTDQEIEVSNEILEDAVVSLKSVPKGPVQVNVPLHEPLYELAEAENFDLSKLPLADRYVGIGEGQIQTYQNIWQKSAKKMIIIGQYTNADELKITLDLIAEHTGVAILVENTSNLQNFYKYCHSIDRTLALISEDEVAKFSPDLIVSFGGAIVSKKIKAFLRENPPNHNWRVGKYLINEDTFLSKTATIETNVKTFLGWMVNLEDENPSNYGSQWKSKDFLAQERHQLFMTDAPFSDLLVIDYLLDTLPEGARLQMANSSVVRYCQLFNPIYGVKYYANRGVSGIDGSTSTAVGMAVALPNELVTLITGDISFFYDSNGLWNSYLPQNLRIILINNGGGGIFNILEGSRKSPQNKTFVAPHTAKAAPICEAFNVHYTYADSMATLTAEIQTFYTYTTDERPRLLEINTSQVNNHEVLMAYFKFLGEEE